MEWSCVVLLVLVRVGAQNNILTGYPQVGGTQLKYYFGGGSLKRLRTTALENLETVAVLYILAAKGQACDRI